MNRLETAARAATAIARMRAAAGGVVLGYHDVVTRDADDLSVTADALRAHIRLVRRLGLRIAPLAEMRGHLLAGRSTAGLAALTFDDGLVGLHRYGLAVLAEEQAPATLFAVSNAWGAEPAWWPGSARVMTRAEFRDVVAAGVAIEAHTRTHASLPALDDLALERELGGCRAELEDLCGSPVRAVAYPNGHHDGRVRAAARRCGYEVGFTFLNGRLTGAEDLFTLPRFTMTAAHGPVRLAYHLARPAESWPNHQLTAVGAGGAVESVHR